MPFSVIVGITAELWVVYEWSFCSAPFDMWENVCVRVCVMREQYLPPALSMHSVRDVMLSNRSTISAIRRALIIESSARCYGPAAALSGRMCVPPSSQSTSLHSASIALDALIHFKYWTYPLWCYLSSPSSSFERFKRAPFKPIKIAFYTYLHLIMVLIMKMMMMMTST